MSAALRTRLAPLVMLAALLAGACALGRAQGAPLPGGTVPSTLTLSLGKPSPPRRTGSAQGKNLYTATLRAEVSATDAPTRLSLLGPGLPDPPPPLRSWREPVSGAVAKLRLSLRAPNARALHDELLWVTLSAAGP